MLLTTEFSFCQLCPGSNCCTFPSLSQARRKKLLPCWRMSPLARFKLLWTCWKLNWPVHDSSLSPRFPVFCVYLTDFPIYPWCFWFDQFDLSCWHNFAHCLLQAFLELLLQTQHQILDLMACLTISSIGMTHRVYFLCFSDPCETLLMLIEQFFCLIF